MGLPLLSRSPRAGVSPVPIESQLPNLRADRKRRTFVRGSHGDQPVPGAKEFFEKETVRVVAEIPRAVQSAARSATKQYAGRRERTGCNSAPD